MTIVSVEEEYLIFDSVGAIYVGEFGHGLKPPVYTRVNRWCVMDRTVQRDVVMDILVVLLGSVNNYGRHEVLPIISCEYE